MKASLRIPAFALVFGALALGGEVDTSNDSGKWYVEIGGRC